MAIYECKNKGCQGSLTFEAADADWWAKKGLSLPSNCPDCREWIRAQTADEKATCIHCKVTKVIRPKFRISYHKQVGIWDPSNYVCKACLDNPGAVMQMMRQRTAKQSWGGFFGNHQPKQKAQKQPYLWAMELNKALKRRHGITVTQVTAVEILTDPAVYLSMPDTSDRQLESRLHHIMNHHAELSGTLGSWTAQGLLDALQELANATDPQRIAEFKQGQKVVKYDKATGVVVILSNFSNPPPPFYITTAFTPDQSGVVNKIRHNIWRPAI